MARARAIAAAVLGAAILAQLGCALSPDPWSPKTYRAELRPYSTDTGALPPSWKRYQVKGMEDIAFFFAHDSGRAAITVSFTCGKYDDVPLEMLAEHLAIPMGRKARVLRAVCVRPAPRQVYRMVARGDYLYQKEAVYLDLGRVPDERADTVLDAYLVREPHCLVDLDLAAAPDFYESARSDFENYLTSMGVPVDRGPAPGPEGESG